MNSTSISNSTSAFKPVQGPFTASQLYAINTAERVSSAFSLVGALFIILTFTLTDKFGRPINRLAFYASFGNIMSNIATLIARDPLIHTNLNRPLCNFQALFIQVFLPADALFCMCMAINVYLTVIHKYTASQLRRLELPYIVCCYTIPFILGFVLLFISTPEKGPVYDSAVLWCWIGSKWDVLRIAAFYAPVWVIICFTFILYALTGRVIFKLRHSLRQFAAEQKNQNSSQSDLTGHAMSPSRTSPTAIQMTTVTQVEVSSPRSVESRPPIGRANSTTAAEYSYSVTVECARSSTCAETEDLDDEESFIDVEKVRTKSDASAHHDLDRNGRPMDAEAARRAAARARGTLKANAAAFAYARCAILFFIGLLITWIPSSMNRVYSYVHTDSSVFALSLASGLVLPAQGLWNGFIYAATSWKSCKSLWRDIVFHFQSGASSKALMGSLPTLSTGAEKKTGSPRSSF